jgi:integrase
MTGNTSGGVAMSVKGTVRNSWSGAATKNKALALLSSPRFFSEFLRALRRNGLVGEGMNLRWNDINFEGSRLVVRESKTPAGRRVVPLSEFCKAELHRWRGLIGPEFSAFVFPNFLNPSKPLGSIRKTWSAALRKAGLTPFPIYSLRATFASRLSAAGVPGGFVSQMLGHTGGLSQTYSKAVDEYRRDAVRKLDRSREEHTLQQVVPEEAPTGRPN